MAADFAPLTPAVRMTPSGSASTAAGERPFVNSFKKRPWIVDAAAPASCWYMIDRTRAAKWSSTAGRSSMAPAALISRRHRGVAPGDQAGALQQLLLSRGRRAVGPRSHAESSTSWFSAQANSDMSWANSSGVSRSSLSPRSLSGR